MALNKPDYSIVIPAFNEGALLSRTLESVREAMASVAWRGEIIVCDNNSTDNTAAIASQHGARVVFEPHNQIARARNTGAGAANGNWLVFLDADTLLPPALLEAALEALACRSLSGGGATVLFEEIPGRDDTQRWTNRWNRVALRLQWAAGSFIFCHSAGFHAIGGFDTTLYAAEEIVFVRRYKGWVRRHRQPPFRIIPAPPVVTSPRKLEWYSDFDFYKFIAAVSCFPWLLRSRNFCRIWYHRPVRTETPPSFPAVSSD